MIARACDLLAAGEPVALPTETVYGLAADALRPDAILKIFEAKKRPFFDPLIVHLPDIDWLARITEIPPESHALVDALIAKFWPGPLTLVLPRRDIIPDIVTAGLDTVAVRMSAHPVFRSVIERFAKPLAAPSANRFGRISPTTADHVRIELSARIPLIVDGGATTHGIESTIVAVEGASLRILRAGPVTPDDLEGFAAIVSPAAKPTERPEAPGQLKSHYAPRTPLILQTENPHGSSEIGLGPAPKAGLLAWRFAPPQHDFTAIEILSPTGDLREAAATLFTKMRRLDEAGLDVIFAEPVPETGLGIAIMDRLRRASARE